MHLEVCMYVLYCTSTLHNFPPTWGPNFDWKRFDLGHITKVLRGGMAKEIYERGKKTCLEMYHRTIRRTCFGNGEAVTVALNVCSPLLPIFSVSQRFGLGRTAAELFW